jgi:transposase
MKRDGLIVDSQTLWDQVQALAMHLQPAYDRLKSYVLSQPVIGADETHWKLMGEPGKKQGGKGTRWQVWAICCPDAAHYSFEGSRSAETAKQVLGEYAGIVLTDGYAAYDSLKKQGGKFTQANCWAHVRRKFLEVEEQHPGKCETVLDLIGQLYEVERQARGKPPDEVLALRRENSKPTLLAIQNWALEVEALPESNLGKAIAYMAKLWNGLRVYVDHHNVDIDNNATERALRGLVMLVSLCVTSLNAWNHQVGVSSGNPTRAA